MKLFRTHLCYKTLIDLSTIGAIATSVDRSVMSVGQDAEIGLSANISNRDLAPFRIALAASIRVAWERRDFCAPHPGLADAEQQLKALIAAWQEYLAHE